MTAGVNKGKVAAQNILATIRGDGLKPFRYSTIGLLAPIGKRTGVANILGRSRANGGIAHAPRIAADQAASGSSSEDSSTSSGDRRAKPSSNEQACSAFAAAVSTARLSAFSTFSQDAT